MASYSQLFNPKQKELTEDEEDELITKAIRYRNNKTKAKLKAEEEFYMKKERLLIKLKMNDNIPDQEYLEMEELLATQKKIKEETKGDYALFITINPKDNLITGFNQLDKLVKKCLSKYWITDYAYCYEQRSDNADDIHGLHAHILLTRNLKPSHCKREIQSTFKSIVGIPDKHINIQFKKKEWIPDKINYMLGNKTGEGKEPKTEVDKLMRKTLGIEDIYYSENCAYCS